jgi:hypothetical protein
VLDYTAQRFVKTPAYKRVVLRGSQRSTLIRIGGSANFKGTRGLDPGLTEGVDREFIETWLKQHPKLSRYVWVVEKPAADLKHQVADRPPHPLEPLDPLTPMKIGSDLVDRADFTK